MDTQHETAELGAVLSADGRCRFRVWAPKAQTVSVVIVSPDARNVPMARDAEGYFTAALDNVEPGALYWLELDGHLRRPDPASRSQPQGVHGASEVVSAAFAWTDGRWAGIAQESYIIYELHVGTFTPEGTFDAVIPRLDSLAALGVTAIEVMPIGQFPGHRNWGYDGVGLYAAQNTYGGVSGFKRLVDACHARGLAVVLDVVYNHLGPEGNYLADFGPYFTDRYKTPWGQSLNYDGAHSDHVRRYFIENALYWIADCHVDSLRLDATQAMTDLSAFTVMDELVEAVQRAREALNRKIYLMAETDRSDDRLLRPIEAGGVGVDAQWSDEVHHVLHVLLTGESFAYYRGWEKFSTIARALRHGFVYSREFSVLAERRHGSFRADLPAKRFVVCAQNHDHVGNRKKGDRLGRQVSFDALKLAAGVILLSPYLPLLFMGEEYDETSPFLFFTSFGDPNLREAVRAGRAKEFRDYFGPDDPHDPESEATFQVSKLDYALREHGRHRVLLAFYTELIRLRKSLPALRHLNKDQMEVIAFERQRVLFMRRWHAASEVCALFNFSGQPSSLTAPIPEGAWTCVLASADARWQPETTGQPETALAGVDAGSSASLTLPGMSFAVFVRQPHA